jgi:hypothetical protein
MLRNPAGERNVVPIIETLKKYIGNVRGNENFLEISSGQIDKWSKKLNFSSD